MKPQVDNTHSRRQQQYNPPILYSTQSPYMALAGCVKNNYTEKLSKKLNFPPHVSEHMENR